MRIGRRLLDRILCKTPYLHLKQTTTLNGEKWVYAHRPNVKDVVVVVPIVHTPQGDHFVFLESRRAPLYREGKSESCIEFPGGLVGDNYKNQTQLEAAQQELLEETGYKADTLSTVEKQLSSSAGCVSETSRVYIADINGDKLFQPPVDDGGVILKRHMVPVERVAEWIREQQLKGKSISAEAISGIFFAIKRNKLTQEVKHLNVTA